MKAWLGHRAASLPNRRFWAYDGQTRLPGFGEAHCGCQSYRRGFCRCEVGLGWNGMFSADLGWVRGGNIAFSRDIRGYLLKWAR